MEAPHTLQQAIIYFSDADRAFQYALNLRFPNGVVSCPRCGSEKHSFIKTRKVWFCSGCKKQFSLKVGTIFEDSPLGLDKWMCAYWILCNSKNGVSSCEIARTIGVTQKSAWFMLHRIRETMKETTGTLSGIVEMDETFVGGKIKNMHKSKKPVGTGKSGRAVGSMAKTVVVGMLERKGRIRAKVVQERTHAVLSELAAQHVAPEATLVTDEWSGYRGMEFQHEVINHAVEYVNGHIHTNGIETFGAC